MGQTSLIWNVDVSSETEKSHLEKCKLGFFYNLWMLMKVLRLYTVIENHSEHYSILYNYQRPPEIAIVFEKSYKSI